MKTLKIPKGDNQKSAIERRDNTMTKRKRTNGQTMKYTTLHRKLKIEQYERYQAPW